MRVFARAVPAVTLSGLSGCVRAEKGVSGRRKALTVAVLRRCVRFVREILYCLTYTRARDTLLAVDTA